MVRLLGLDEYTASWLSSTIGLSSVIGRPFLGSMADYLKVHPIWSYCINQVQAFIITNWKYIVSKEQSLFRSGCARIRFDVISIRDVNGVSIFQAQRYIAGQIFL